MNELILKKYILGSLIFHLLIVIFGIMLSHSSTIRHTFVVLGVHSKKTTKTLFKNFENYAPFKAVGNLKKVSAHIAKKEVVLEKSKKLSKNNIDKKEVAPFDSKKIQAQKKGVSIEPKNKKIENSKSLKKIVPEKKVEQKQKPDQKKKLEDTKKESVQAKKQFDQKIHKEEKKPVIDKKSIKEVNKNSSNNTKKEQELSQKSSANDHKADMKKLNINDQEVIENCNPDDESFSVSFSDKDMILYDNVVRCEIGQRWQSPPGVSKGTECTVRFEIASSGTVKSAELVRRSNVLIFDLGALRAARTCTFARCLWGKIFQVDFRQ